MWVPVPVKDWYQPLLSLTLSPAQATSEGLSLMRNTAQLRKLHAIPQETRGDSLYKPIVRQERDFGKLKVPAKLQEALPFASKPKVQAALATNASLKANSFMAGSLSLQPKRAILRKLADKQAVLSEPTERNERALLSMLSTIKKDKLAKRSAANASKAIQKDKQAAREKAKWAPEQREERKRRYKDEGLKDIQQAKKRAKSENKAKGKGGKERDF